MKKMKKTWLILLSVLLVLLTLSACDGGTPADSTGEESGTAAPAADIPLVSGGTTEYIVVRSDTAPDSETKAAVLLRNYMQKCGVKLSITTDWEKNPVSDYEIVIGDTLRSAEQGNTMDPHSVGERGYFCYTAGTRIYIGGGSDDALMKAVEVFLTEFFGYAGDPETASPVTDVVIPGDYSVIEKQNYDITSFTVAGKDLSEYRIVVDSTDLNVRNNAKTVQEMFYSTCGVWLEIVPKTDTWDGPSLILTGKGLKKAKHFEVSVENGNLMMKSDLTDGHLRGIRFFFREQIDGKSGAFALDASYKYDADIGASVSYSEFGAKGDGKTNDIAAIIATHNYANANGIPVKADKGATYYISAADSGATIQTDTDWTGAKFIIDDSEVGVDKRGVHIFNVASSKKSYALNNPDLKAIKRDATNLGITLPEDSIVILTEAGTKRYIREGANQNDGSDQTDIIVVSKDGSIDMNAPLIWDYTNITSVSVTPMDTETLTIKGGEFTTIANRAESAYNYYNRGIRIARSNTVVDGLVHYVTGEGDHGAPYSGILVIQNCANITVQNCTFTGHKTYSTIGAAGTKVSMGTYDIGPAKVINLTFKNCKQTNDILDTSRWGIMGSNFCKNIVVDGCEFSRFDAHQGVANVTILNSKLGHQCLNAIGCGTLRVEGTTLYGNSFINLRSDYGSTWEGDVVIKNCTWVPNKGNTLSGGTYAVIGGSYSGFHDFGYPCYMPANITIEGLHIDDSKANASYKGIYLFGNITSQNTSENYELKVQMQGYPYHITEKLTISGFTSVSGKKWNLSPNTFMFRNVEIVDLDESK
ncbi:MAG: hypothetical protein E7662_03870 [Ruminococcaceae bacterium]|nr:hypothetical protein [Oscillospiraceae bacterium]